MSELSETGRQIVRELGGDPDRDTPGFDKTVEESLRDLSVRMDLRRGAYAAVLLTEEIGGETA